MTRTAVVTGAYGFVGRHASRRLSELGWRVIGIGHGGWGPDEWQRWGLTRWHHADIDLDAMFTYAEEPELVLHCAGSGSVGFSVKHPYQDFRRTVGTTMAVLEFVRVHVPTARVVYPSSAAVYGAVRELPISEASPLEPVSPYGVHKKIAEDMCRSFARHSGVRTAVVRLFSVYGPELRKQLLWDAGWKLRRNETTFFGTGAEKRDWLYISDAVDLLLAAGDNASVDCPIANGGTGVGVSVSEILGRLFAELGQSDQPQFSGEDRAGDPAHYVAGTERATAWGWSPKVDWRSGLERYAEWFKGAAR